MMVGAILLSTLLWADVANRFVLMTMGSLIWLAALGFMDDYIKLRNKRSKGLSAKAKFVGQIALGLIVGTLLSVDPKTSTALDIPFVKNLTLDLGLFYGIFVMLVVLNGGKKI